MRVLFVVLSLLVLSGCAGWEYTAVDYHAGHSYGSHLHPSGHMHYSLGYYIGPYYNGYRVYGDTGHRYYYAPPNYTHHRYYALPPIRHTPPPVRHAPPRYTPPPVRRIPPKKAPRRVAPDHPPRANHARPEKPN